MTETIRIYVDLPLSVYRTYYIEATRRAMTVGELIARHATGSASRGLNMKNQSGRPVHKQLTAKDIDRMYEMLANGMGKTQIARELGVTHQAIHWRITRDQGLTRS
jgi:DNA invertase Pin-like site-specific DNA recombinase